MSLCLQFGNLFLQEVQNHRTARGPLLLTSDTPIIIGYQSNVADHPYPIHTVAMGVQTVLIDFMRWITVGTGTVLGIILLVGLCIPRRSTASLPRHLAEKSR